ncbi:sensor histidine kinase [Sandarakinorhabdus oryzae]|uniref:sensor histidine kinase n=1 Tax=Sandarakinorhabdus oryzae TaxID=2675220 RepID=UPI0012E0DAFD|nr:HAMP domain-containing sensor histidine kinase [Sandarakinorhabdus oryzae]
MKTYSLRRASLSALAMPLVFAMLVTVLLTGWFADRGIEKMRDDQLRQEAGFLLMLSRHEAVEGEMLGVIETAEAAGMRNVLEPGSFFRIWSSGTIMTQTQVPAGLAARRPEPGFSTRMLNGERYRTFALTARADGTAITIEISEPLRTRSRLREQVLMSLALPMGLALVIVLLLAQHQLTTVFRPMRDISAALDARAPDDLSPLRGIRIPIEVLPLFKAFNGMLDRLATVVSRERQFADNAAHELRTPLAALKARAQIMARSVGSPSEQQDAEKLVRATDRTIAVIEQLLQINRINAAMPPEPTAISPIVEAICRQHVPAALDRQLEFGADIAPDVWAMVQPDALAMLVRNLLQNALRYTPPGGEVTVVLHKGPDATVELLVQDTGSGIPEAELDRVFERFQRLDKSQSGSGLGLAIAKQIVERMAGQISLSNRPGGGLEARIILRSAVPAADDSAQ